MDIISNVIASLAPGETGKSVVKIDPVTGCARYLFVPFAPFALLSIVLSSSRLCEFPPPGDARYYTLPMLKDPDADKPGLVVAVDKQKDEYWMPVRNPLDCCCQR